MFDGTQISGMELKSGACLEQTPASGPQTQPKDTHDTSTPNNAQTSETRSDADILARIAELQREAFSLGTAAFVCALSHSTLPFFFIKQYSSASLRLGEWMYDNTATRDVYWSTSIGISTEWRSNRNWIGHHKAFTTIHNVFGMAAS